MSNLRVPAVAGLFYPAEPASVSRQAAELVGRVAQPRRAVAVVCPHAGWMYSGKLAGKLFGGITVPERVVILAPNHTGLGVRGAVWTEGTWKLPGLDVPVDAELCQRLCDESTLLQPDRAAHAEEHAIEVLLPLLAARQPRLRIAPVVLGPLAWAECETLGRVLARVVQSYGGDVLIVASSDMNHYKSDAETRTLDQHAIEPMKRMDPYGLFQAVKRHDLSMCGYVPATAAMVAARELGAGEAELIGYATSADAGGDTSRVVGYAAVAMR